MYETTIDPENSWENCYTSLPFIPPVNATVAVEDRDGRSRFFLINNVQVQVSHRRKGPTEPPEIELYLGATEYKRESLDG